MNDTTRLERVGAVAPLPTAVAQGVDIASAPIATSSTRMSRREYWLRRLWKLRLGVLGGLIVLGVCGMAILAPVIAPYDPLKQDLGARLVPPFWDQAGSWAHPLGTDRVGRDTLSRLMWGARISLATGALATVVSLVIGVVLGILAG